MAYLLDSNLVIPYLADDPTTVLLVERLVPQGVAISIISCKYMEVYQGTLRSPDPQRAQDQFERFLAVVPTLPLSPAIARRCAPLVVSAHGQTERQTRTLYQDHWSPTCGTLGTERANHLM